MRATVFRAKDNEGRWRRGFILPFDDGVGLLYERDPEDPTICGLEGHFVDQNTVGQYTGIADSQANPIFEGDILETEKYGVVEVIFANAMFETRYFLKDGNDHRIPFSAVGIMKVIGNIHDNPELIKRVKNENLEERVKNENLEERVKNENLEERVKNEN